MHRSIAGEHSRTPTPRTPLTLDLLSHRVAPSPPFPPDAVSRSRSPPSSPPGGASYPPRPAMSLAEFGFPQQRLRTVSAQLRGSLDDVVAHQGSPSLGSHAWSEWTHTGYSPDRQPGQNQAFFDPCADLMSENDFDPSSSLHAQQRPFQHGLGFKVQMQMVGIEEGPAHAAQHSREASKASLGTGADPSHFLARQDSAHAQVSSLFDSRVYMGHRATGWSER